MGLLGGKTLWNNCGRGMIVIGESTTFVGEVVIGGSATMCGEVIMWGNIVGKFYCGEVLLWGKFYDVGFGSRITKGDTLMFNMTGRECTNRNMLSCDHPLWS